ncbi:MAG: hypothetical protein DRI54_04550 [Bacteroidetes bacterium]|nr:MAG: hypothetical protein DRI54_04550 [Bacteroidota bacterium]
MKNRFFYNDIAFRLLGPIMFGFVIYLLVLMFFDSIEMLTDNFFSREVLFTIGLSYLFFELNRLIIIVSNRLFNDSSNIRLRIIIQYVLAAILSVAAISYALYLYFVYVEGFSTIQTELFTFNSIFIIVALFYHLFFFSLMYLNKKNDAEVEKELIKHANLESELQSYKYQINPELLFQTLEIIIGELHNDKKAANTLVLELSKMYRYTLDNQDNDLVSLKDEINSLETIFHIFKAKYPKSLYLNNSVDEQKMEDNLIPGTLRIFFEKALSENIISEKMKLEISIKSNGKELYFGYITHPKISHYKIDENKIAMLNKAYRYYSSVGIRETQNQDRINVIFPLLSVEGYNE